jgi:SAM-dependent methyltransferase
VTGRPAPGRDGPGAHVSDRWARWRGEIDLDEYDTRWERRAAAGHDVHGEADLVVSFGPRSVLDAGCGMGRVAIELARRGCDTVGVDLDEDLLVFARRRAPDLAWHAADLATLDLGRRFDVVVLAGNVVNFCRPDARSAIVASLAAHLEPGGRLVAGFEVESDPVAGSNAGRHIEACVAAGLVGEHRWSSWDRRPLATGSDYALLIDRRPIDT